MTSTASKGWISSGCARDSLTWVALGLRRLRPRAPTLLLALVAGTLAGAAATAWGSTGLWDLERRRRIEMGGDLYRHRPRPELVLTWQKSGFITRVGEDHLFADKRSAIAAIVPRHDGPVCANGRLRVFEECAGQPMPASLPAESPRPA